jgi:hypothetical protein
MSYLREELDREREAYTADPADCERCRFAPRGLCRFHESFEILDDSEDTLVAQSREGGIELEKMIRR